MLGFHEELTASVARRLAAMSTSGEDSDGPTLGSPMSSRTCRSARSQLEGAVSAAAFPHHGGLREDRQARGQTAPGPGPADVNKLASAPTSQSRSSSTHVQEHTPWDVVLTALAELREEVNELKKDRPPLAPRAGRVNDGAGTSQGTQYNESVNSFRGFSESGDASAPVLNSSNSILLHNAKVLGPPDPNCVEIDQQIADMVNYLFTNGMRSEDHRLLCEDEVTKRPKNCHGLAPVECNPEVLDALRTDAKKTDHRLMEVNQDILRAATIVTKSLLALDKVAQVDDLSEVAREVDNLNGALALLGTANYKNNLARRFVMKREINSKYAHLCSSKVPVTSFLFGDDVSNSAKQIEDSEKLKFKFAPRKPLSTWSFTSSRGRGFWGAQPHRSFARFQPYGVQRQGTRGAPRQQFTTRQDSAPKNAKGRGQSRPRQH